MLCLTRKKFERIRIGNDIYVSVLSGTITKLGIECPPDIKVVREELIPENEEQDDGGQHDKS